MKLFLSCLLLAVTTPVFGQTYYYVGPDGGDFFDEANWNESADGLGAFLTGDPLVSSTTNAFDLDLIIDGATVEAAGQVDIGTGSLSLLGGSVFTVVGLDGTTGDPNVLDVNSSSTFTLVDSTLTTDWDMFFEGDVSFTGGTVTSLGDDIEFQDNLTSLLIDGTVFDAPADNIIFDGLLGTITNASFSTVDRLSLRNTTGNPSATIVMTDTDININGGAGDVDDVFTTNDSNGAILVLDGSSTLLGNQIDDGASLVLDGFAIATLTSTSGAVDAGSGGMITLSSLGAKLILVNESGTDVRSAIFNGYTGLSYADDPSAWNVSDWDGIAAVSLQVVPEPATWLLALLGVGGVATALRRQS